MGSLLCNRISHTTHLFSEHLMFKTNYWRYAVWHLGMVMYAKTVTNDWCSALTILSPAMELLNIINKY